ncbi:alanine racemase [Pseudalkalibacillus sp. A8]|uniref:alanine racemase n=1 Tax=Pseudalkalibacillus sp. A8 TaxID=3382641 RepID=UPI0038B555DA
MIVKNKKQMRDKNMLSTPYVYIDSEKLNTNINTMQNRLSRVGIDHWPHIKTHKSVEIARKQLAAGAKGITCAKLSEAEVFADAGIVNIFIAYPIVGQEKLDRLQALAEKINIRTIADSHTVAEGLSKVGEITGNKIEVLIEIDGGSHRGGVQSGKDTLDFALELLKLPGIELKGLFTYVGQIYALSKEEEVKKETLREAKLLLENKELLHFNGIGVQVTSGGSTLSSYYADQLKGITESRAGNYVFGDINAVAHGIYTPEDCALRVCSSIVSLPLPGYATIDAGSKALTSDLSVAGTTYGFIIGYPDVDIVKLNEEHGYLRYDPEKYNFEIGDQIEIVPNHCCVIPNLNEFVHAFKNGVYKGEINIDARGKNY